MAGSQDSTWGEETAAYTAAEVTANGLRYGAVFFSTKYNAKFIFLKNNDVVVIGPSVAVMALGTDKTTFGCKLPTADEQECFAGVRVVGADNVPVSGGGWFQVTGSATFTYTSAGTAITVDNAISVKGTAGRVQKASATAFSASARFAIAQAAQAVDATVVVCSILANVFGIGA